MSTERIVAVDFGTSTSVIRVKRYLNDRPIGDRLVTMPVTFNMGSTMVPTLVQKMKNTGESVYFGHEAEIPHKNTETFRNFKVDIESPNLTIREQARALTAEFFDFLAKTYRTQSEGGHLGENDDRERTIISYPVKWDDDTKAFMLETARSAGFPNVEGQDEAQAAIQAVTVQSETVLRSKGYFISGKPVNILLIDMGAGTTDLVLCRHTPSETAKTEILATWPKEGGMFFGGREADELLKNYICAAIPEDSADIVRKKIGTDKFKAWKETVVSPALVRGESVDYFSALDDLLGLLDIDAEYRIDRSSLERFMADYLRQLPELIKGCLDAAAIQGNQVDLVILAGGHSQWYFVREILSGRLSQFGDVRLSKIEADPARIISISLPQETVALGMAYQKLDLLPPQEPLVFVEGASPACLTQGRIAHWRRNSDGACFADETGSQPLAKTDIPALGHSFRWSVQGRERVEVCTRCGQTGTRETIAEPAQTVVAEPEEPGETPESEFILTSVGNCYGIGRYIGDRAHVEIPGEIRGLKVVAIGDCAFSRKGGNTTLQSIVIPPSVTTIGAYAFNGCQSLHTVIAHKNITVIGEYAFFNCKNLARLDFGMGDCPPKIVRFPPELKSIGLRAFDYYVSFAKGCAHILREVWLSKKTKATHWLAPVFTCAVFYYDKE